MISVKYQLNHAAGISDNTEQIIIKYLCKRFYDFTHMSYPWFLGMVYVECAL